jgi:hypothetical protein
MNASMTMTVENLMSEHAFGVSGSKIEYMLLARKDEGPWAIAVEDALEGYSKAPYTVTKTFTIAD